MAGLDAARAHESYKKQKKAKKAELWLAGALEASCWIRPTLSLRPLVSNRLFFQKPSPPKDGNKVVVGSDFPLIASGFPQRCRDLCFRGVSGLQCEHVLLHISGIQPRPARNHRTNVISNLSLQH